MIKEAKILSLVSLYPMPQYVVVLEDLERTRLVPIWIGVNEGNAIALEMQGEKFPRPLTHDLMVNLLKDLGGMLEKVVISDLKNNSYFAILFVKQGGKVMEIDARPSDSLALAVRVKCPIFVDEKVLKKCPRIDESISKEEIDKFKDVLKTMPPEEFFKKLEETPPDENLGAGTAKDFTEFLKSQQEEGAPDDEEGEEDDEEGEGKRDQ